jgi:hypothetical protein
MRPDSLSARGTKAMDGSFDSKQHLRPTDYACIRKLFLHLFPCCVFCLQINYKILYCAANGHIITHACKMASLITPGSTGKTTLSNSEIYMTWLLHGLSVSNFVNSCTQLVKINGVMRIFICFLSFDDCICHVNDVS